MQSNTTACEVADTGSRSAYAKGDDECNSAKRQRFEPPSQSGGLPTYPGTSFPCHEDAWMHPCRSCQRFTGFSVQDKYPLCRSCQHTLSKLVGADVLTKGLQLQNASLDGLRKRSHSSYQDSNKGSSPFLSHDFCSKGLEAVLTLSLDTPETSVLASTYSGSLFGLDSPPFSSIISIRTNNCAHGASCSSGDLRL